MGNQKSNDAVSGIVAGLHPDAKSRLDEFARLLRRGSPLAALRMSEFVPITAEWIEAACQTMADSLRLTVDELADDEKRQAVLNAVLTQAEDAKDD